MSLATPFWAIPPIQDAIAINLTQKDLWQLIQTCSSIHHAFLAFLWHRVHLNDKQSTLCFLNACNNHENLRHYISTLQIPILFVIDLLNCKPPLPTLPNLTSIAYASTPQVPGIVPIRLIHYAGMHSMLQRLYMDKVLFYPALLEVFLDVLDKSKHLCSLKLGLDGNVVFRDVVTLLEACGHLEALWISSATPIVDFDNSPWTFTETRIKSLDVSLRGSGVDALVVDLLAHSPLLEHLRLNQKLPDQQQLSIRLVDILQTRLPRLRDLELPLFDSSPSDLGRVFDDCPSLVGLTLSVPDAEGPMRGLNLERHFSTLKSLDLAQGKTLSVPDFFSIGRSCPCLESLWLVLHWDDLDTEDEDWTSDVVSAPWVCTRLLVLDVLFQGDLPATDSCMLDATNTMYKQVGRLKRLQELRLRDDWRGVEFSEALRQGLESLSGLKWLRTFYFSDSESRPLEREQLEWMLDQWPMLENLHGTTRRVVRPGRLVNWGTRAVHKDR